MPLNQVDDAFNQLMSEISMITQEIKTDQSEGEETKSVQESVEKNQQQECSIESNQSDLKPESDLVCDESVEPIVRSDKINYIEFEF